MMKPIFKLGWYHFLWYRLVYKELYGDFGRELFDETFTWMRFLKKFYDCTLVVERDGCGNPEPKIVLRDKRTGESIGVKFTRKSRFYQMIGTWDVLKFEKGVIYRIE